MNKKSLTKIVALAYCFYASFEYVRIVANLPIDAWNHYAWKPFIYRTLVPTLGVTPLGILIVTVLFLMGLATAMMYAYRKYWVASLWNDIMFVLSFSLILLILIVHPNYYDPATAFFFLVILLLWMEDKYFMLIWVFILACLNRETTVLIIPVLFIIKRHWTLLVHIVSYIVIRAMLLWLFNDAYGQTMYIHLFENLRLFWQNWALSMVFIAVILYIAYTFTLKALSMRPEFFLFVAFLLPVFTALYLVAGYAFEVRVFAEVMPVLFMGTLFKL